MNQIRVCTVALLTLTLLFGLQIFRIFLPSVIWYLGQYFNPEQLALYALATFGLTLLAPVVVRCLGERGALALSVGGLALVRLAIQMARPPLANLLLATAGLGLLGWFVPLLFQSRRSYFNQSDAATLAVAFPLAFLIDTATRSLLLSFDLAWRYGWAETLVVMHLVGFTIVLLGRELKEQAVVDVSAEPSLSYILPLARLGLWFYLAMAITHNPSALMALTGWDDAIAHLVVNGLTVVGAAGFIWVMRRPTLLRWPVMARRMCYW